MMKYAIVRKVPDGLMHHGIKGQRWGVRRFQNEDGTWTEAGKERYGLDEGYKTDVTKYMKTLRKGLKRDKEDRGDFMGQSNREDIHLKSGSIAKRLSNTAKENGKGHAYVTFDDLDHMKYASMVAELGSQAGLYEVKGTDPEGYGLKFKITSEMVMPSYNNRMESMVRSIGKMGMDEVMNNVSAIGKQTGQGKKYTDQFLKDFGNLKNAEARDRAYHKFIEATMKNENSRKIWFNDLKERGYNAVVDNYDVGLKSGGSFKTSTIVFDRSDMRQVGSEKYDKEKMKRFMGM